MAEAYYVQLAPHNPCSPVATAVAFHVDACAPNFRLPTRQGIGLELDDSVLTSRPHPHDDRRVALCDDGAIGLV
jgi:L-alanine-DL-glutamate epimerase-like enolase superfamily enzyme